MYNVREEYVPLYILYTVYNYIDCEGKRVGDVVHADCDCMYCLDVQVFTWSPSYVQLPNFKRQVWMS